MKTTEIKVGTDYAHYGHKWATARKVRVLAVRQPRKEGWGYSAKTVKNGVLVIFETGPQAGQEVVVPSREIERPWAEQERMDKAAKEAREARDNAARKTAARRANVAKRLDAYLEAHGVETRVQPIYGSKESTAALKAIGYEMGVAYGREGFLSRVSDLDDVMRYGRFAETDVEALLADVAVSA